MVDTAELQKLELAFWLEGGGNPAFWEEHFAEEGIVALPMGVMDKTETIAAMEAADGWESVEITDVRVARAGDAAVMAYRATGRPRGSGSDYTAVITSVYRRRGDGWELLAHQQSPVA